MAQIEATIAYYQHHQSEIDAYMERLHNYQEQRYQDSLVQKSPAVVKRIKALKMQRQQEQAKPA